MDTKTFWREVGYDIGYAKGREDGVRAMLWLLAAGATVMQYIGERDGDPFAEGDGVTIARYALMALDDLGDPSATAILGGEM